MMKSMGRWGLGLAVAVLLVAGGRVVRRHIGPVELGFHEQAVEAGVTQAGAGSPRIGNCPIFPADNVWNTRIDSLPKDSHSDAYIDSIGPLHPVHPDFASNLNYGIPYSDVPPGTRGVHVEFEYADESDKGSYPIPADVPIEGGARAVGDRHILLIDQRRCLLYELWEAQPAGDGNWKAGSGAKWDLTGNATRAAGTGSADAGGLPILPGLVRYEEVAAGEIHHALRFTLPHTRNQYVWPATHMASRDGSPNLPPMGERFRLRADFDLSRYSPADQVILRAMQRYGMILADNGSAMFLSGVPDKRWDDSDLHKLGGVKAEDFEAVDESDLQLLPNSARVDPTAVPH